MAKFYVGQRIKKIRGIHAIGAIATFAGPALWGNGCDGHAIFDNKYVGTSGRATDYGDIITSQWEPVVPPHEACDDAEFIASLDKLAQRVGEMA